MEYTYILPVHLYVPYTEHLQFSVCFIGVKLIMKPAPCLWRTNLLLRSPGSILISSQLHHQSSPHQRLALFADPCFGDVHCGHSSSVSQYYHQQQNSFSTTDFVSTARTHMCFPISIRLTHPSLRFHLCSKNSYALLNSCQAHPFLSKILSVQQELTSHMCFPKSIKLTHPSLIFSLYSKNSHLPLNSY